MVAEVCLAASPLYYISYIHCVCVCCAFFCFFFSSFLLHTEISYLGILYGVCGVCRLVVRDKLRDCLLE